MYKILCITNRKLVNENFIKQIETIAAARPDGIVLREKDLPEPDYYQIAEKANQICRKYSIPLIIHSFPDTALKLGIKNLHMPLPQLKKLSSKEKSNYEILGASCHSQKDVEEAIKLGCTYVTVGHIFDTDCKKGLPGRGLPFLKSICENISIPVYAIGGITETNASDIVKNGADGICLMSSLMKSEDPIKYIKNLRAILL